MRKASDIDATDLFCGAGGFSTGIKRAGVRVRMALNHWDKAIECHNLNHPDTDHERVDISVSSPKRYPSTRMLIGGPSCTNHTLAKGIRRENRYQPDLFGNIADPSAEKSRATMWDIVRFSEYHRYDIVIAENVVDARAWILWDAWIKAMTDLDYKHQPVYFNSMFAHPTPQSRDRMYVVFWRKGNKAPNLEFTPKAWCAHCEKNVESRQTWKNGRTAGKYKAQYIYTCPQCRKEVRPYYYAAANAIDWSIPVERIGDRKKPLKPNTLRRIQVGLDKYARPITVDLAYSHATNDRSRSVMDAMNTITTQQTTGLAVPPFIVEMYGNSNARGTEEALGTVMTNPHHGLAIPFLTSYYGTGGATSVDRAMPTITTKDRHALVMPMIVGNYTPGWARPVTEPTGTVTTADHHSLLVPPFIVSYYTRVSGQQAAVAGVEDPLPTQPTWPIHYLAQPGESVRVEDCGFRMLQPHELQKAMGFPDDYILVGDSRTRVKLLGNAVTPPVAQMLAERCIQSLEG